jgi:23S rRNA (guanosine2251-2'-O)-methyltransferase
MREMIYGRNPVYETLRARRRQIFGLQIAEGVQEKGHLAEIFQMVRKRKLPIQTVLRNRLDRISPNHQGVALEVSAYPYRTFGDMLDLASERGESPFLLLLDSLQDPQNFGTLLRTAEAAGLHGVVIPLARSAEVTPAVVSSSSGASEHLLIAQSNLAQVIDSMKQNDIWVVGLEGGETAHPIDEAPLDGALALVVGSEAEGMRVLIRQKCDYLASLPMLGQIDSLNAAVAGSIAIYLALSKRLHKSN